MRRSRKAARPRTDLPFDGFNLRRFAWTFSILVGLLLVPWPRYGKVFGVLFSAYADVVVCVLPIDAEARPRFTPLEGEGGDWMVNLSTFRGGSPEGLKANAPMPLETRILGYTPLAIFAALSLATPVRRRRRLKILIGGSLVMLARLAVAIDLPVAKALGVWRPGIVSEVVWWVLINPPVMAYATPILVWWIGLALTAPSLRTGPSKSGKINRWDMQGNVRATRV